MWIFPGLSRARPILSQVSSDGKCGGAARLRPWPSEPERLAAAAATAAAQSNDTTRHAARTAELCRVPSNQLWMTGTGLYRQTRAFTDCHKHLPTTKRLPTASRPKRVR